ncbi:hypothetical protein B0I29_13714 [Actinoplanes lutulentus]|uniref:PLAT/LH2 domain-containing protein n=1 Tax=Actinoplanes lutulentus TaxID=1287878 RepID=A0A327YVE7_9ACTN|nr:hypothetical protein [Actinoplanes lutulentus]RAK24709.1 hypothetical protein B0I29_13714 [Actinoplanes lutulentus]
MFAPIAAVAATLALAAAPAAPSLDALAQVYDETSQVLAEAHFVSAGDSFRLTKRSSDGGRAFVQYKYIRTDGTFQSGEHRGPSTAGASATFDHDFGEGRKILFRVCVDDYCSGTGDGQNWTIGYA